MPTSSDDTFQPASISDIAGERSLGVLFAMHLMAAFAGWITPLMISEGGTFCLPYNLAFLYSMLAGCLLHFATNIGIDRKIWWLVLPLGALFLTWSIPFGVVFLLYLATIFAAIRSLHSQNQGWKLTGILYVILATFMITY